MRTKEYEMRNFFISLLNFILPHKCAICTSYLNDDVMLCHRCWQKVEFINAPSCFICDAPFQFNLALPKEALICGSCQQHKPFFDRAISVFKYSDHIKNLIHQFKYYDRLALLRHLSKLLYTKLDQELLAERYDFITFVPLHPKKLRQRLYNQSALLAGDISKRAKIPFLPDLLLRVKYEQPQTMLSRRERLINMRRAFAVNDQQLKKIEGKKIIIIDDVMTTGATLNECSRLLHKHAAQVVVATIAKTLL